MNQRPRITLSYAQSLDGRIATLTGDSQWISGDETMELAHRLRDEHDAILVGAGTVLADNPQLTCRLPGGSDPHRVVLDGMLRVPLESHIVEQAREVPTTIFCSDAAPASRRTAVEQAGVRLVSLSARAGRVDLDEVLRRLHEAGIATLLVEGGAGVLTEFFSRRVVDRLVLVSAPVVIGTGTQAVADLGVTRLRDAWRGSTVGVRQAGQDVVWEVRFAEQ